MSICGAIIRRLVSRNADLASWVNNWLSLSLSPSLFGSQAWGASSALSLGARGSGWAHSLWYSQRDAGVLLGWA